MCDQQYKSVSVLLPVSVNKPKVTFDRLFSGLQVAAEARAVNVQAQAKQPTQPPPVCINSFIFLKSDQLFRNRISFHHCEIFK